MHLKKYRGPTVKEVLRAVRAELGPSALVLSTEVVPAAGVRGWMGAREVEVTVASERIPVSETRPGDRAADTSRAVREVAARLQAGGMDAAMARGVAEALPAGGR